MPWEMYPWEFAKGRRCRKAKYSGEGVSESGVGGTEEGEGGEGRRRAASQHVKGDGVEGRRAREEANEGTVRASGDRVRVSVSVSELLEAAVRASPGPTTHQAPANNNNASTSTLGTSREPPVARELRKERMMDAHRHRRARLVRRWAGARAAGCVYRGVHNILSNTSCHLDISPQPLQLFCR
ncbi:hypothetical protein K439DRAFT_1612131 [Ramaria rubella]|nr:hypothetical protein K439DRAFT_1612131 [Ramaria rubella]